MSAIIEAKKQQVDTIAEQLKNSVSTVIVDYRGLTVAEVTELRSQLREAGVEYKVYKNTMVRRAAEQAGIEGLDEFLTGPTAIATSTEDVVAPAKVIAGFAKEHEALEVKTGVWKVTLSLLKKLKQLVHYLHTMVLYLCFYLYYKHLYATSLMQLKLLENKKKKALNNCA